MERNVELSSVSRTVEIYEMVKFDLYALFMKFMLTPLYLWIYVLRFGRIELIQQPHMLPTQGMDINWKPQITADGVDIHNFFSSAPKFSSFSLFRCSGKKSLFHATHHWASVKKRQKQLIFIQKKWKNLWTYRWQNTWSFKHSRRVRGREYVRAFHFPFGRKFFQLTFFLLAVLNMNLLPWARLQRGFSSRPARAWVNEYK